MPIKWDEEPTKAPKIKWDNGESSESNILYKSANVANELNYGLLTSVGLQPFAEKIGIGIDRPEGQGGQPTPGQGALRMAGQAAGTAAQLFAGQAALARNAVSEAADVAINGVRSGVAPSVMRFLNETAETAYRNPKLFWAAETATSTAAGAAGQYVFNETNNPTLRTLAEVGASIGTAMAYPFFQMASSVSPTFQLGRSIVRSITGGEVPDAVKREAAKRIRAASVEQEGAIRKAEQLGPVEGMTLAGRSGDPGLLALEKAIVNSSEELTEEYQKRYAEINERLRGQLAEIEPSGNVIEDARMYLSNLVEERLNQAAAITEQRVSRLQPNRSREDVNVIARQEIDRAYSDARDQERQLWQNVPDEVTIGFSQAKSSWRNYVNEVLSTRTGETQKGQLLPDFLQTLLGRYVKTEDGRRWLPGKLKGPVSVKEMQELRSEVLRASREMAAKDAPNRRVIGMLNSLADDILADMSATPASDDLSIALSFSRDLNKRFRQGNVGQILGFEVTGEGRIAGMRTLEATLGRSGMSATQAVDELMAAVGPERQAAMTEYASDFIIDEFRRASIRGGEFSPKSAINYVNRRQDLLQRFPQLRQQMEDAIQAGNAERLVPKNPDVAAAGLILGRNIGTEIQKLMSSASPAQDTRRIVRLLQDKPNALNGFKNEIFNYILRQSETGIDANNVPFLDGKKLNDLLSEPNFLKVANAALSRDQMKRLEKVKEVSLRLYRQQRSRQSIEAMEAADTVYSQTMRRLAAAAAGRKAADVVGTKATLQWPAIFVEFADKLADMGLDPARKVIVDAITSEDDTLLKELLREPITPKDLKKRNDILKAWIYSTAQQYGISMKEYSKDLATSQESQSE